MRTKYQESMNVGLVDLQNNLERMISMKIIKPGFQIMDELNGEDILKKIEMCGRVCYKSEDKITEESAKKFVKGIIKSGHESVLEHHSFTVRFIIDRGISHEIVRHRIASYSQESTRYCNYNNGGEITVIDPLFWDKNDPKYREWKCACYQAEQTYLALIQMGASAQEARNVLPTSLKTELIVTKNIRQWRHFLKLRTDKTAHPQIRQVCIPLLLLLDEVVPVVFEDLIKGDMVCPGL